MSVSLADDLSGLNGFGHNETKPIFLITSTMSPLLVDTGGGSMVSVISNDSQVCTNQQLLMAKLKEPSMMIYVIFLLIINCAIIAGNTLVIVAVSFSPKLRTVTNHFIVSLAVADLLLGLTVIPYSISIVILDVWIFGEIWCKGWLVIDVLLSTASILNLVAISVDRYVAVTRPVRYKSLMTSKKAKIIIIFAWIIAFCVSFPPLIGWGDQPPIVIQGSSPEDSIIMSGSINNHSTNCIVRKSQCVLFDTRGYVTYSSLGSFYIPMSFMMFFYWRIYVVASRTTRDLKRGYKTTKGRKGKSGRKSGLDGSRPEERLTLRIHRGCIGTDDSSRGDLSFEISPIFNNPHAAQQFADGGSFTGGSSLVLDQNAPISPSCRSSINFRGASVSSSGTNSDTVNIGLSRSSNQLHIDDYTCNRFNHRKDSDESQLNRKSSSSSTFFSNPNARYATRKDALPAIQSMSKPSPPSLPPNPGSISFVKRFRRKIPLNKLRITVQQSSNEEKNMKNSCEKLQNHANLTELTTTSSCLTVTETPVNVSEPMISTSLLAPPTPTTGGQSGQVYQYEPKLSTTSLPSPIGGQSTSLASSVRSHFNKSSARSVSSKSSTQRSINRPNASKLQAKRILAETKAAKTVGIIVGGFIICWFPFFTTYLIRGYCQCVPPTVIIVLTWLGYVNSAVNPVIYGMFYRDFRRAFKSILCKCRIREENGVTSLIKQIHLLNMFQEGSNPTEESISR